MTSGPAAAPDIEARGLGRRFGPRTVLHEVDLDVLPGETFAVFGPNGAGKTTLIRVLVSALRPSSGGFRIAGLDPSKRPEEVRAGTGLLSHRSFLYDDLSARENIEFFARLYGCTDGERRADELLGELGLGHRADDPVRTFSRGMQQRVSIARSIAHDPQVLFLDEPFSGLDAEASHALAAVLERRRDAGRTAVLVTHDLRRGHELCDAFVVLQRGRVAERGRAGERSTEEFERDYLRRFRRDPAERP
ncbi:MAG: ABC transporter ATP-binding protein [bacterium]|nr:ABC transporter ATP-binding protein [bacterium]